MAQTFVVGKTHCSRLVGVETSAPWLEMRRIEPALHASMFLAPHHVCIISICS